MRLEGDKTEQYAIRWSDGRRGEWERFTGDQAAIDEYRKRQDEAKEGPRPNRLLRWNDDGPPITVLDERDKT